MSYPQVHEGRYGIGLVTGEFYPHSFGLADLDTFEDFVAEHERCMWYSDVAHESVADTNAIAIRHDVDHSIVHALRFAAWEADRGINSTYFILPTAPYYTQEPTREIALEIEALGHEVGVHNDAHTHAARLFKGGWHASKDGSTVDELAMRILADWTAQLRSWGLSITGCADHGGGDPHNVDLWKPPLNHSPEEAGLAYEAYALHARGSNYISDNRGGWRSPLEKVDGRQSHVLIHPCHWRLP